MKILVIDDVSINIEVIRSIFKQYKPEYQLIAALSGKEGLELAQSEHPDVVILDYLMPGMNGFEVCRKLREHASTTNIPVLMISALGDDSKIRTQGLNAGADAFISKPFDAGELIALVKVMIRIKNAEDLLRQRNEELEVFIRKQSRHYLDSEERFLQISRHAGEFFWEIDRDYAFTFISKSAESILGQEFFELNEKTYFFDLAANTPNKDYRNEIIQNFDARQVIVDKEFSFLDNNGNPGWLSINGFPVYDQKKEFTGYRGVCDNITRRKTAEDKLKRSIEEIHKYQYKLKKLNREFTLVEEKERKQIAEYLHDSIGQTLSLAYMNLSMVTKQDTSKSIEKNINDIAQLLNKAIHETRLLTYDLSPPILYELGLLPALKWKLDQVSEKFNVRTELIDQAMNNNFNAETRIVLYRIICELITNTVKHAKATRLSIKISKQKEIITIEVADNGVGFLVPDNENHENTESYGLFSINERLEPLNGKFSIHSEQGKGTLSVIHLPEPSTK